MSRQVIHTENAPAAIGTYSQAILVGIPYIYPVKLVWILIVWNWLKALKLRFAVYSTT